MQPKPQQPWEPNLKQTVTGLEKNITHKKITHVHKLFRHKGTVFYTIGYIETLLYLEIITFLDEVTDFDFSFDDLFS